MSDYYYNEPDPESCLSVHWINGSPWAVDKVPLLRDMLPCGDYLIGDPCYLFREARESALDWSTLLRMTNYFRSGDLNPLWVGDGVYRIPWENGEFRFAVSDTLYGDGAYGSDLYTNSGDHQAGKVKEPFYVDSGHLAAIPTEMVDELMPWIIYDPSPDQELSLAPELSQWIWIDGEPEKEGWNFSPCDHEGVIKFGPAGVIHTREMFYDKGEN